MGIVNVTPDSFSDGGSWPDPDSAIAHGLDLLDQGADLIDVGGESTRPGAQRPSLDEELRRVVPVVQELSRRGAAVSVDTMRSEVAQAAVEAGATIVNDVSGGLADPAMFATVAALDVRYVLMHWRAHAATMQQGAQLQYTDVVTDVCHELQQRIDVALAAGIQPERLIVDPGFGFSKTVEHNWQLLRHLDRVDALGFPMLVGVSRKSFLGALLAEHGASRPPELLDAATAAISSWCATHRVWAVRTHTVGEHLDAALVASKLLAAEG